MNGPPRFNVDQKTFVIHQLGARLQDNGGQRLTSALITGLLNEMLAVLPSEPESPVPSTPETRPLPDRPTPAATLGARRHTKGAAHA